jgi:two-component system NtrC family sensor kinase
MSVAPGQSEAASSGGAASCNGTTCAGATGNLTATCPETAHFPGLDEAALLALLGAVPARIAFLSRDRRHLYANREYCRDIGLPVHEVLGKTIAEILGDETYERLRPLGERALAGETVEWEGWINYPRLGDRFVRRVYKPYVQPDGSIEGYFVLVSDRTGERHHQEVLERERARLLDAIESFSEGFALWDAEDRLVMCNARYLEMYAAVGRENIRPGLLYWDHAVALARSGATSTPPERAEDYAAMRVKWRHDPGAPYDAERAHGRWVRVIDRKTTEGGTVSIRIDVTDIKRRESILSIVNAAASQVLMSGGWRPPVEDMLSRLGPVMRVSRVLLTRNPVASDGRYLQDNLFQWAAPGISRRLVARNPVADLAFQDDRAASARGELVHARVSELPQEKREWMALEGVMSYMRVPIMAGGQWWGSVGFDDCLEERVWRPLEIETLRTAAGLIGVAIAHDQTLSALRDSEQRFRGVLESAIDGIITIDDAGLVVEFNPAAEAMFAIERNRAVGAKISDFINPERLRAADETAVERYLASIESRILNRRIEVAALRGAGEFPAELTVTSTRVGGRSFFTAHIRDLTQQKEAEREIARQRDRLYQSEKINALGSLLAGVAHELNNPLSIVVGQALMLDEEGTGELARRAAKIRTAAERCSRIVKTFLAMARQRSPEKKLVDLNQVVRSTLDLVGYGIRSVGIEVLSDLAGDLPNLNADPDQLGQLVTNLVLNAQHALKDMPEPRRLSIRTRYKASRAQIRLVIADNGPGIPRDLRSRVFEPFFTTKPVGVGTGVGLSICDAIVRGHGGWIEIEETPGGGASFTIRLPVLPGDAGEPAELPEPKAQVASRRALVVDDERGIAELLAEMLGREGFTVDVAVDGNEATSRLLRSSYDLILSDIRMPGLDGPALLRWLEGQCPDLVERLIFVTGDTLGLGPGSAIDKLRRPIIEKPVTPEELRRVVNAALSETAER